MPAPSKNYTLIPDGSVDADSPLDTTLITQLRDNTIHIEEWLGDSYVAAKNHDHDNVNSKAVTLAYLAGDLLRAYADTEGTGATTVYVKKKEIVLDFGGAVRIKFDLKHSGSGTTYGRIYRNGVAVGTERSTTSDTYVTFSEDISGWSPGDLCQLYIKQASNPNADWRNFRLYSSAFSRLEATLDT